MVSAKDYTETRLQIRLPQGPPLTQTFSVDTPLSDVFEFISKTYPGVTGVMTPFPRKEFGMGDRAKSLKELNLVPSAALVAKF